MGEDVSGGKMRIECAEENYSDKLYRVIYCALYEKWIIHIFDAQVKRKVKKKMLPYFYSG